MKTLTVDARTGGPNEGPSTTVYKALYGSILVAGATVEAGSQATLRTDGVFSNLSVQVKTNDRATSTLRFRVNLANGNQVISITGSTTGRFEDTSNTDSLVSGDEFTSQLVCGAGGTTLTFDILSVMFEANNGLATIRYGLQDFGMTTSNGNFFRSLGGANQWTTTEANHQFKMRLSGTLKNFAVNVTVNGRSTTSTSGTRINGGNGNQSVSIAGGVTGIIEDTTNTDTVISGTLAYYFSTNGTGSGSLTTSPMVEVESRGSYEFIISSVGSPQNAAVTGNYGLGGRFDSDTESFMGVKPPSPINLRNLRLFISANSVTSASTWKLRKNSADTSLSASIPASTTGWFEDAANAVSAISDDLLNFQLVTGSGGTSMTLIMGAVTADMMGFATVSAVLQAVNRASVF